MTHHEHGDRELTEMQKLYKNIERLTLANDKLEKQIIVYREADRRVKERDTQDRRRKG